jgi:hypothetical protein
MRIVAIFVSLILIGMSLTQTTNTATAGTTVTTGNTNTISPTITNNGSNNTNVIRNANVTRNRINTTAANVIGNTITFPVTTTNGTLTRRARLAFARSTLTGAIRPRILFI